MQGPKHERELRRDGLDRERYLNSNTLDIPAPETSGFDLAICAGQRSRGQELLVHHESREYLAFSTGYCEYWKGLSKVTTTRRSGIAHDVHESCFEWTPGRALILTVFN
jgi:hypothetical protein